MSFKWSDHIRWSRHITWNGFLTELISGNPTSIAFNTSGGIMIQGDGAAGSGTSTNTTYGVGHQ